MQSKGRAGRVGSTVWRGPARRSSARNPPGSRSQRSPPPSSPASPPSWGTRGSGTRQSPLAPPNPESSGTSLTERCCRGWVFSVLGRVGTPGTGPPLPQKGLGQSPAACPGGARQGARGIQRCQGPPQRYHPIIALTHPRLPNKITPISSPRGVSRAEQCPGGCTPLRWDPSPIPACVPPHQQGPVSCPYLCSSGDWLGDAHLNPAPCGRGRAISR